MFKVEVKLKDKEEVYIFNDIIYFMTVFNYFGMQGIITNDKTNFEWKDIKWVKINSYNDM